MINVLLAIVVTVAVVFVGYDLRQRTIRKARAQRVRETRERHEREWDERIGSTRSQ
jgi:cell division protein FtsL